MILDDFAVTDKVAAFDTRALATVMQDEQMHRDLLERTPMQRGPASSSVPGIEIPAPPLEPRAPR